MIRCSYHGKRSAFTMIELIFAIVVIAIAVLSLPTMNRATQRGAEEAIVQEAVFAAAAELMGASAGYWDEMSMSDINQSAFSRVINITHDCNNTTKLRPGHIPQPFHRRCLDNNATMPQSAPGGSFVDLDDVPASSNLFSLSSTSPTGSQSSSATGSSGYKDTYTSNMAVTRNGHVKTIASSISDSGGVIVRLKLQSANIGEVDYYKRTF